MHILFPIYTDLNRSVLITISRIVVITVMMVFITSCDPGYSVEAHNYTSEPRHFTVIMNDARSSLQFDSVYVQPISNKDAFFETQIPTTIDTANRTYSFTLQPQYKVLLHRGLGFP